MFEQNVKQQVMKSKSEGIRETHNTEYNPMMWPLKQQVMTSMSEGIGKI